MPKPPLPDAVAELLTRPNHATITSLRASGQPVSVPTWYLYENGRILVNMDEGRKRLEYLRNDPRVALSAMDPEDWVTHVSIQGRSSNSSTTPTWPTSTGSPGITPGSLTASATANV